MNPNYIVDIHKLYNRIKTLAAQINYRCNFMLNFIGTSLSFFNYSRLKCAVPVTRYCYFAVAVIAADSLFAIAVSAVP